MTNLTKKTIFIFMLVAWGFTTSPAQEKFNTDVANPFVKENSFIGKTPDKSIPPTFEESKNKLPQPEWAAQPDAISAYWKAWEIAFANLYAVDDKNGFVSPYVDAAFNRNIFMWDNSFMVMFGRYAKNAFHFQGTLDNFYCKQHKDGFISREISEITGNENFEKYDVSSTGPNLLPWAEWEYYQSFNDLDRLGKVFPPLVAFYQWFRTSRTWKDGSYFSSGWGCGMDNQPRLQPGYSVDFSHGFMSWVDITMQQIFVGDILVKMAEILGRENDVQDIANEISYLKSFVNANMWDEHSAYYYDIYRDGSLNYVKSIAAYWALLANVVPENNMQPFLAHLENKQEFNRYHRPPTLSADHPDYEPDGGYWRGGVWAPTSYMLLKGLTNNNRDSLAHAIATSHYSNVIRVFKETGTFWENYAPEEGYFPAHSRKDFVGWTGIVPISILFEYIFGIRSYPQENLIVWDVRLTDTFGLKNYPFGNDGLIDFQCRARKKPADKPKITVWSNQPFKLKLIWEGGSETIQIKATK